MADKFVRVRLVRITGVDLNIFDFDFDLTLAVFFMNADGKVYGRYGARDAKGPDTRNTLAGLRYAMRAALEAHRRAPKQAAPPQQKPFYIEKLPIAKQFKGCLHCHNVKEIRWAEEKRAGQWDRAQIWSYPLPENVGITLDLNRGNLVKAVAADSPAAQAGLKTGDLIQDLNGYMVRSFADAQYALHRAPSKGRIAITWERNTGDLSKGTLVLPEGWRWTNITWRPSILDLLPALRMYGSDLTAAEKRALGLDEKRLAFRQEKPVHSTVAAAGIRENDIVIGIDDQVLEMTVDEFLGHVRRNYLIGDRIALNILRDGKRVDVSMQLK